MRPRRSRRGYDKTKTCPPVPTQRSISTLPGTRRTTNLFITPSLEPELYSFIKNRIVTLPNVYFHAVGGIADHCHLAASFYPPFEIDRRIGEMKGASSHEFGKPLQWQSGYGIVSFGTKDLDWVVSYVRNQKERHKTGRLSDRLERISDDDFGKGVETP